MKPNQEQKTYTVRDAYNDVFAREYKYATFKGLFEDQANRHAAKLAVKYAWIEFTMTTASK